MALEGQVWASALERLFSLRTRCRTAVALPRLLPDEETVVAGDHPRLEEPPAQYVTGRCLDSSTVLVRGRTRAWVLGAYVSRGGSRSFGTPRIMRPGQQVSTVSFGGLLREVRWGRRISKPSTGDWTNDLVTVPRCIERARARPRRRPIDFFPCLPRA